MREIKMNKISQAICFATEAFDGMVRKAEEQPAIFHSLEAGAIAQSVSGEEDVVCAAILHDTVEDTRVTMSEIREQFGERVAYLVASETENKYPNTDPTKTWMTRKEESLKELRESTDLGVKALWLGDKLSNIRSFSRLRERMGDRMWNQFNQKDPKFHEKYYRMIAKELEVFADREEYREYITLINKVFGE